MLPNILKNDWLLQDSLVIQVHVIQLNVHRQKFFQCMANFTQQLVQKYQTGSYPQYPDCGEVNITLTASQQAIECPIDSVLNKTDPICSKCATLILYYEAACNTSCMIIWHYCAEDIESASGHSVYTCSFLCMWDNTDGDFYFGRSMWPWLLCQPEQSVVWAVSEPGEWNLNPVGL